jgi:hypothetical protein
MDKKLLWFLIVVGLIGLVAIFYPRPAEEPPPVPVALPPPAPVPAPDPAPFDMPEPEPEPAPEFVEKEPREPQPPLPELDESDAEVAAALEEAAGEALVANQLRPESIVRNLVATVDNLTQEALWINARAVPPVSGRFIIEGDEDEPLLGESNFKRYDTVFELVGTVDVEALARAYQHNYPLLQQAYEELGYPGRQFHNRALEVIDHLLETPRVSTPIALEQPHVLYKFADPALEGLSSGQKIMLRIGPENSAVARSKLIELRAALEGLSDPTGDD